MVTTPSKSSSPNASVLPTTTSPRLRSPRGSGPRGTSAADTYLYAFLRHRSGIILLLGGIALFTMQRRPSIDVSRSKYDMSGIYEPPIPFPNEGSIASPQLSEDTTIEDTTREVPREDSTARQETPAKHERYEKTKSQSIKTNEESSKDSTLMSKPSINSLSSYNATSHPVFDHPTKIQVHLIVDISVSVEPQSRTILDAIDRSAYTAPVHLTFVSPEIKTVPIQEFKDGLPLVWIVDWGSMNRDCHRLHRAMEALHRKSTEQVLLLDFSGSPRQTQCAFWDDTFRLAKRNIVKDRYYSNGIVYPGSIATNEGTPGGPTLHAPFIVREKFVESLWEEARDPLKTNRPIDVAYFWKDGDYSHYGLHRKDVSHWLKDIFHRDLKKYKLKNFIDIVANDEAGMLQGHIQIDYAQKLLSSKIVVVAQRDEWEDHYRLMESLASGALVMTDPMLAAPAGLKNKTNVIVYDSPENLKQLIKYYLKNDEKRRAIAKKGYQLALGRHRSWHRLEEILFGKPLTHVDKANKSPPKKPSYQPMDT